jgi:hypothetical protein
MGRGYRKEERMGSPEGKAQAKKTISPGPWTLHLKGSKWDRRVIKDATGKSIIIIEGWTPAPDAKLAAAGWDLLNACKEALDWFDSNKDRVGCDVKRIYDLLEAAYMKAKKGASYE